MAGVDWRGAEAVAAVRLGEAEEADEADGTPGAGAAGAVPAPGGEGTGEVVVAAAGRGACEGAASWGFVSADGTAAAAAPALVGSDAPVAGDAARGAAGESVPSGDAGVTGGLAGASLRLSPRAQVMTEQAGSEAHAMASHSMRQAAWPRRRGAVDGAALVAWPAAAARGTRAARCGLGAACHAVSWWLVRSRISGPPSRRWRLAGQYAWPLAMSHSEDDPLRPRPVAAVKDIGSAHGTRAGRAGRKG